MAIKCKGCGIELQYTDPGRLGYSPKQDAQYCQRCFRMTHYDDAGISMRKGIDEGTIMEQAASVDGLIVWVMDCFDLEAGILNGMHRHFIGRDVILAVTKCDLLPKTMTDEKLFRFISSRLKQWRFNPVAIALLRKGNREDLETLTNRIELFRKGRDVLFMGKANAGKSTLLNGLLRDSVLTVTRYPGTTLDFNEIEMDGWKLIDTPGLLNKQSLLMKVDESDLKTVLPESRIKPQIYQFWENQSFAIGGLCRIDLWTDSDSSAVFYLSSRLKLHRGKRENADVLWNRHQNELLVPTVKEPFNQWRTYTFESLKGKVDLCIYGLGWVTLSGSVKKATVTVPSNVEVIQRKAMI